MVMDVYSSIPWYDACVDAYGKVVDGDAERLAEHIVKWATFAGKITMNVHESDLFSASIDEVEPMVKIACAIATKEWKHIFKGFYMFDYFLKDGAFIISIQKKERG